MNDKTKVIEDFIRELNPFCTITKSRNCNIVTDNIFTFNFSVADKRKDENVNLKSSGKPDLNAAVLRTGKKTNKKRLSQFLEEFAKQTYRLKGYVVLESGEVMAVQSCFGNYELTEIKNYHANTEIVAMGENVLARRLKEAFENI